MGHRNREQLQLYTRLTKGNFEGREKKNTAHASQLYIYPFQCIPNVVFLDSPRSFLFFLLPNQSFSHVSFFIFKAARAVFGFIQAASLASDCDSTK